MTLRSPRHRIAQTAAFEASGLAIVVPAHAALFGASATESAVTLTLVTLAVLIWSPLHNTVFDRLEFRRTGRTACRRPARLRIVHALSHEISALAVTVPLLIWIGGHSLTEIAVLNLGLTLFYTGWTALFHKAWDTLFPVAGRPGTAPGFHRLVA